MKPKIFKSTIAALAIVLITGINCFAQTISTQTSTVTVNSQVQPLTATTISVQPLVAVNNKALKVQMHQLTSQIKVIAIQANAQVIAALNNVHVEMNGLAPTVAVGYQDMGDGSYTSTNSKDDDDNQLIKNYSKTYTVDANDALSIENRYGNVVVNTWNKNEIKVDVLIKVSSGSESETQKIIDNVTISDDKNGNNVSFRTNIGQPNNSWISFMSGGHSGRKIQIDYTVYMPSKNELTIDNRYGSIVLPDLQGKVTINSAYGSFTAKSLSAESAIRVKYGSASIESLGSSSLEVAYGSLQLGSADKLVADVSYSGANIGKIKYSGAINMKYGGGLKIGDLDKNVKNLAINSSYSSVSVGLSGDESASFDVTVRYGSFDYDDHNVTVTGKSPSDEDKGIHFTKSYKGYVGKGNSDKTIAINSNYGSVKFE